MIEELDPKYNSKSTRCILFRCLFHLREANAALINFGGETSKAAMVRIYLGLGLYIPIWALVTLGTTSTKESGESSFEEFDATMYSDTVRSSTKSTPNEGDTVSNESSGVKPQIMTLRIVKEKSQVDGERTWADREESQTNEVGATTGPASVNEPRTTSQIGSDTSI